MPKKKTTEVTRASTRRAASKEALKQMQLLLGDDDDTYEVPTDDEIIAVIEPPKKKYKLSHRKSSDGNDRDVIVLKSISNSNYISNEETLELDCTIEELSEIQLQYKLLRTTEMYNLEKKLEKLANSPNTQITYKGELSALYELNELIAKANSTNTANVQLLDKEDSQDYHLIMDPRLGIIVGNVQKNVISLQNKSSTSPKASSISQITSLIKEPASLSKTAPPETRQTRMRKSDSSLLMPNPTIDIQTRAGAQQIRGSLNKASSKRTASVQDKSSIVVPTKNSSSLSSTQTHNKVVEPTKQTSGVLTRNVTSVQTRNAHSKSCIPLQKSNSKQHKDESMETSSGDKAIVDLTSDEGLPQADTKEIAFNKLQGKTYPSLVVVARPHLRITDLNLERTKLDLKVKTVLMHSPTKFTEWLIQQGLVRAEQKCPVHSSTVLKLGMYSDVSKFPFSGGYVWISECCAQRFISVFNGSLFEGSSNPPMIILKLIYHWACQTNIQNVTQWVKVDNLYVKGVYTWLRAACTVGLHNHMKQLGGPGVRVEVGVISLGTTSHDGSQRQVKVEVLGVLESVSKLVRLRAVEPLPDGEKNFKRKFSKILEPILVWVHPSSTLITDLTVDKLTLINMGFTNIVQTTTSEANNNNRSIMEYLRKIVPRMFQNTLSLLSRPIIQQFLDELVWRECFGTTACNAFDNIILHLAEQTRLNSSSLIVRLNKIAANPFKSWLTNTSNGNELQTASSLPTQQVLSKTVIDKRNARSRKTSSLQTSVTDAPKSSKSVCPDVPEPMVPLENYYYGTIDPGESVQMKVILNNIKCPFCKCTFENNLELQNHLFKHAQNVSNDAYLCRYCLTTLTTANELVFHVSASHPSETKSEKGFACLLCETHYVNPFVLGKHMSKEHSPLELPYQCGSCIFRCSNHKQAIDHFYLRHNGGSAIQCPFCLKSTSVWSGGRNVVQNMTYFMQHLQKHQRKNLAKKCGKCNLWFVQKEGLKDHQLKMHLSLRGKIGLTPWPAPRNGVMVPKSRVDKNPCSAEVINFSSLTYKVPEYAKCKECSTTIESPKHFSSFNSCQNSNCQYSSCCANAMTIHNKKCKGLDYNIPSCQLPYTMFCICGYNNFDGNGMAKHLALCEKKSAYSSEKSAKSATVTHSMLDVLGLVRKLDESVESTSCILKEQAHNSEQCIENNEMYENENKIKTFDSSKLHKINREKEIVINIEDNISNDSEIRGESHSNEIVDVPSHNKSFEMTDQTEVDEPLNTSFDEDLTKNKEGSSLLTSIEEREFHQPLDLNDGAKNMQSLIDEVNFENMVSNRPVEMILEELNDIVEDVSKHTSVEDEYAGRSQNVDETKILEKD